jgi:hypothetical protein
MLYGLPLLGRVGDGSIGAPLSLGATRIGTPLGLRGPTTRETLRLVVMGTRLRNSKEGAVFGDRNGCHRASRTDIIVSSGCV